MNLDHEIRQMNVQKYDKMFTKNFVQILSELAAKLKCCSKKGKLCIKEIIENQRFTHLDCRDRTGSENFLCSKLDKS